MSAVLVKKNMLLEPAMPIYFCIVYDCFHAMTIGLVVKKLIGEALLPLSI
jgi:hypothetical protein